MTFDELFAVLLSSMGEPTAFFDYHEVEDWPEDGAETMASLGLLVAGTTVEVTCPECDDWHVEPVEVFEDEGGHRRLFIACPQFLRVEITENMTKGWRPNPEGLAQAVARALNPKGRAKSVVEQRYWRVGTLKVSGQNRNLVLAVGLEAEDGRAIANHLGPGGRAIVLVPDTVPDERIWPGAIPAVLTLAEVARVEDGQMVLDAEAILAAVDEADQAAEARSFVPTDPAMRKQVIEQAVHSVVKNELTDEVFLRAYRETGSYRKAGTLLTEALKRPISKDRVRRAVLRNGGPDEVMRSEDSASVSRRVASSPRDRATKFHQVS
ncbi:MAG: hypothetical protein NCW75_11650 [Phycisphaera sp.]|nr:MAG: hypothetical protein NCW75_11650 [Phycisphaera sp.]